MTARKTVEAWHFAPANMTTRYDGRPIVVGKALTVAGPVVPCERGLHASERIIDALAYSPNESVALCRVKLGGEIVPHGNPVDKLAATRRTCLWALDGDTTNRVLRVFARQCALDQIHRWNAPKVVRRYLETGDETIRAAAGAAAGAAQNERLAALAWAAHNGEPFDVVLPAGYVAVTR